MDSEKRKRPPNFRLEIPGDENLKNRIQEKFQEVKRCLTPTHQCFSYFMERTS